MNRMKVILYKFDEKRGMEIGMAKGMEKEKLATARRLLSMGLSDEQDCPRGRYLQPPPSGAGAPYPTDQGLHPRDLESSGCDGGDRS